MFFWDSIKLKAKNDEIVKLIAGGIIKNNDGKILLLQRPENDFMGGILELPSGNIESNETIKEGLIREVKEETNLDTESIGIFVNSFDYLSGSGKKSRQFNFEVKVKDNKNIILTEHDNYVWYDYNEIENSDKITEEVKYAIKIYEYNSTLNNK